jgi:hypothetical protein
LILQETANKRILLLEFYPSHSFYLLLSFRMYLWRVYMQLKRRPLDILWGPITREERKKSNCLSEASFYSFSE